MCRKASHAFATFETRRELESKCIPQLFLGWLLGTRRSAVREFKIPRRRRPRKRRLKGEFAFFQSLSRLLQLIYIVKCERTLFLRVQKESRALTAKKCTKTRAMHVQRCCFAYSTYCFFDVFAVVAVVASLSPSWHFFPYPQ